MLNKFAAIFSGEVTNFSEVGGPDEDIIVINREASSGTRGAFTELVMEYKDDAGEKQEAEFTVDAIEQASNGNVRTFVSETPNSIGYISFGFLDDSTAPANIDGVAPSIANVLNGFLRNLPPLQYDYEWCSRRFGSRILGFCDERSWSGYRC